MTDDAVGRLEGAVHVFPLRVYYEDTDSLGLVYYANYLKFVERARTEFLRLLGVDQSRLRAESGASFVVRRATIDYRQPARLDDRLEVHSRIAKLAGASLEAEQVVRRGREALVEVRVTIACIAPDGRPLRLPGAVRAAFARLVPAAQP